MNENTPWSPSFLGAAPVRGGSAWAVLPQSPAVGSGNDAKAGPAAGPHVRSAADAAHVGSQWLSMSANSDLIEGGGIFLPNTIYGTPDADDLMGGDLPET